MNYLIYHPKRCEIIINEKKVYVDNFEGNQDPYLWNVQFLHSFCHITQIKVNIGDTIFWVSSEKSNEFKNLLCDCVFVIEDKIFWNNSNHINLNDSLVDNINCFEHHYRWHSQHYFTKRKRYTLKANMYKSFQPQDSQEQLIDILPILNNLNIATENLVNKISMNKSRKISMNTRPFKLDKKISDELYNKIYKNSTFKIKGIDLKDIYPKNEKLKYTN